MHLGLYSLVPFTVISISNFWLIYLIYKRKSIMKAALASGKSSSKASKHDRMNATVLIMTFLFIAMTSPIAMASFFFDTLFTTDFGMFIIVLVDFISFCYHGLTFLIMTLTNKIFYNECMRLFGASNKTPEPTNLSLSAMRSRIT